MTQKFLSSFFLLLVLILGSTPAALGQQFINTLGDVPLMEGMVVDEASAISFEVASGRIVELQVQSADWQEAEAFYRRTLPSLGWQALAAEASTEMRFGRGNESLSFMRDAGTSQGITIRLAPR